MTVKRWTLVAGSAGLVGGLALGVTGLASATSGTTVPGAAAAPSARPDHPFKGDRGPGGPRHMRVRGAGGLVSVVTGSSMTIRTPGGTRTIALNSGTTYYQGKTKVTKTALTVGDVVGVRLADPKAASPVAAVVTILPAHLAGFVTKVDGGTLTIVDQSGFTRTIRTTAATTYEKDGAAGKASDVTVGALVRAIGVVDSDGTTLDATKVSVGRPAKRPRPPQGDPGAQPGALPLEPPDEDYAPDA